MSAFNLLANSSFEDGLTWWSLLDDDFTASLASSGGWHGDRFVRAVCDTANGSDNSGGILGSTGQIPVSPGEVFTFSVYLRGVDGGVGRTVWPQMSFYSSTGVQVSSAVHGHSLTGDWTRYTVTGTAPAGAVRLAVMIFDWDGTGPTFAVGDAVDVDAAMVNRGATAAEFTTSAGPNDWAGNANYDVSKLSFKVASQGFVLGEGILGESTLGHDSAFQLIPPDFTSLVVNEPSTVEDGLFVRREVTTATLTSTLPGLMAHKGKRLWIEYGAGTPFVKTLFLGTINDASMTETVDLDPHLPGNTATRTHRVSLTASSSTEYFATQDAPPQNFNQHQHLAERARTYLSLGATGGVFTADSDVDSGVMVNIMPAGLLPVTAVTDTPATILDTLWRACRYYGLYWRLAPWLSLIDFESISRPASGGTTLDSALRFTDDPALVTGVAPAALGRKTHTDRTVSYTERTVGEDSALWCTAVTVTAALASSPDTVVTFGPFATPGTARRQDVTVDLGVLDVNNDRLGPTVRNFVSTLPLKVRPLPFTRTLRAPMQSTAQIQGRVPGLATLNVDGADQRIAILSTTHLITPDRWLIDYELGPAHLLTRESDYDPSPPRNVAVTQAGGAGTDVTISWDSPRVLPRDVPIYRQVRHIVPDAGFNGGMVPADQFFKVVHNEPVTESEKPGTRVSITVPVSALGGTGRGKFQVQYTQDPNPGAGIGTFNPAYRLGQPANLTTTIS
ncbi:hypothetical protein [Kribbella deserti]|uniref:CBM-cenC domain-containing protein n=1 Tax=Kribbella deserti TaxID=1926257 RepID=A0ABV6QHZ7_9ACTN